MPELCPATVVTSRAVDVEAFVATYGTSVVKPVDGFAGIDVWLVDPGAAAEHWPVRDRGGRHVIVQQYLPSVADGNKRLFLVDGEIIGAVLRRPSEDDFRIGPPVAEASIDAADRRIAEALTPRLDGARHRDRRARRHRRPADRGQRHLPRRDAQGRRAARHRPQRRDRAPCAQHRLVLPEEILS